MTDKAEKGSRFAEVGSTGVDFASFFVIVNGSRISEYMKERDAEVMADHINTHAESWKRQAVADAMQNARENWAKKQNTECPSCGFESTVSVLVRYAVDAAIERAAKIVENNFTAEFVSVGKIEDVPERLSAAIRALKGSI